MRQRCQVPSCLGPRRRTSACIEPDPRGSSNNLIEILQGDFSAALEDAQRVVELSPQWPKGYSRLGAALHGLSRFRDAADAYRKGLALDPANDAMKSSLVDAEGALASAVEEQMRSEPEPDMSEVTRVPALLSRAGVSCRHT